ncbi:uncharacterized protein LOC100823048 [Brachypodium distachyon]|uniref:Uncharacterized protein n=1 Tax=Brachypodium distachyon TaxID=15368 RepID=I1HHF7_BRADI|nr:uncharacterized protein LOC100823048 [Brachypodium distachyon]KQK05307.1 hypothetical protein BRADI_2g19350v3 [Brachypodium distachyon]|eukprot:XP_003566020.1 uncharacterized protein LOC100823048 [Brachypodium distachyon]
MSCRRGEDLAAAARHRQEDHDDELFEAASSSGEESADEEDRFPDQESTARRPPAPPQPLRRMNSDSVYDMSGMTAQLPAKKGLSMYYQGKSQSFACMTEVRSLEDLQKKEKKKTPRARGEQSSNKMKPCKSYAALGAMAGSNKAAGSCANLSQLMDGNGFMAAPRIPVNENCCYRQ